MYSTNFPSLRTSTRIHSGKACETFGGSQALLPSGRVIVLQGVTSIAGLSLSTAIAGTGNKSGIAMMSDRIRSPPLQANGASIAMCRRTGQQSSDRMTSLNTGGSIPYRERLRDLSSSHGRICRCFGFCLRGQILRFREVLRPPTCNNLRVSYCHRCLNTLKIT